MEGAGNGEDSKERIQWRMRGMVNDGTETKVEGERNCE